MEIDGKKVAFYQTKDQSEYYFNTIKREVRSTLNSLTFVRVTKVVKSMTTDSMYYYIQLKHFEKSFKIALRTHFPRVSPVSTLNFYLDRYENLSELRFAIKSRLITLYNQKLRQLGYKEIPLPSAPNKPLRVKSKNNIENVVKLEPMAATIMEYAYKESIVRDGWANLVEVTKLLGGKYHMTTKELKVKKLARAYTNSGLYFVSVDARSKKWIKLIQ
ncbi:hypothetical protein OfM1_17550 [Lactovum odontotermitis]